MICQGKFKMQLIREYPLGIWSILAAIVLTACNASVSDEILEGFANDYPEALDVDWTKDGELWKVTFYQRKFHYKSSRYTSTGTFVDIEFEIGIEQVPPELATNIDNMYPSSDLVAIFKRIGPDTKLHIFELIRNGELVGVAIDDDGGLQTIASDDERFTYRVLVEND